MLKEDVLLDKVCRVNVPVGRVFKYVAALRLDRPMMFIILWSGPI